MQVARASLSEGDEGREVVVREHRLLRDSLRDKGSGPRRGGRGFRGAVLRGVGAVHAVVDGEEVDCHGCHDDRSQGARQYEHQSRRRMFSATRCHPGGVLPWLERERGGVVFLVRV